jgi:hypothetical protein
LIRLLSLWFFDFLITKQEIKQKGFCLISFFSDALNPIHANQFFNDFIGSNRQNFLLMDARDWGNQE